MASKNFFRGFRRCGLLTCIFSGFIFSSPLRAGRLKIWEEDPNTIYRFQEHLLEAEASVFLKGREPLAGRWNEGKFYFEKLSPRTEIRLIQEQNGEEKGEAIQFNPIAKAVRQIVFPQVPPGSQLDFYYKVSGVKSKKEPSRYFMLKIFAGQHLVKSMRIFGDDENWKKEEINLGVVSFLTRNTVVTFEVSSDLAKNLLFTFYAVIKP